MVVSDPLKHTMPWMTYESWIVPPRIFWTLTLSTLNLIGFSGMAFKEASAIKPERKSSSPYYLLEMAVFMALWRSSLSLTLPTL